MVLVVHGTVAFLAGGGMIALTAELVGLAAGVELMVAGQLVTSGPQEVIVTCWVWVTVTAAAPAANRAIIENCILTD